MKTILEQTQKQILSYRMIQSVEILQMSAQELGESIQEMALENPVLEIEEISPEENKTEKIKKLEWLSNLDEQNRLYYKYDQQDENENDPMRKIAVRSGNSLADYLHMQLLDQNYSDNDMKIFDYIAHSLDHRGYYIDGTDEIARQFSISIDEAEHYLNIMKNLEPYGVCSSTLKECLEKQLEKLDFPHDVEYTIVHEYIDLLGKNQLPAIAKKLKSSLDRVKKATEVIKNLNPKPAQGFDNGHISRYITPDVTIVKLDGYFEILLNNYTYPVLHLNKDYLHMYQTSEDESVKDYLKEKITQIEQMRDAITRRHSTLLELSRCILDVQKEFFLYGEDELHPFRMKDAAERLDVHESTISRAVRDKYLQCCWGIYPLSYFFSKALNQNDDESSVSTNKVKRQLEQYIKYEDKQHPYSDQKLAELFEEEEIKISRRTIAKYREEMGIPNCRGRKDF